MTKVTKNSFTLIELLGVISLLIVLIGITWIAGGKVIQNVAKKKARAEMMIIKTAIRSYKERYENWPPGFSTTIDAPFTQIQLLSKVPPRTTGLAGTKREMFVDFRTLGMDIINPMNSTENEQYDNVNPASLTNLTGAAAAQDPWGNTYMFRVYTGANDVTVWSKGPDGQFNSNFGAWNLPGQPNNDNVYLNDKY